MWTGEEPFRSCHGLRIAVTCLPQTHDHPLNTFGSAYCFSFTRLSLSFSLTLFFSFSFPPPFHSLRSALRRFSRRAFPPSFLLMSRTLRSGIDRCHGRTNTPERTCQRVLMPPVIVISTSIRTVMRMSKTFACSSLCIIKYSARYSRC